MFAAKISLPLSVSIEVNGNDYFGLGSLKLKGLQTEYFFKHQPQKLRIRCYDKCALRWPHSHSVTSRGVVLWYRKRIYFFTFTCVSLIEISATKTCITVFHFKFLFQYVLEDNTRQYSSNLQNWEILHWLQHFSFKVLSLCLSLPNERHGL